MKNKNMDLDVRNLLDKTSRNPAKYSRNWLVYLLQDKYICLKINETIVYECNNLNTVDIDAKDIHGKTTLMESIESRNYIDTKFHIKYGAKLNVKNHKLKTALMVASKYGNIKVVKHLIKHGALIDLQDQRGHTALMISLQHYFHDISHFLIGAGADINLKCRSGGTALSNAVCYAGLDSVKMLIEAGAIINVKDIRGRTPLSYAAHNNKPKIVRYLLESRFSPDIFCNEKGDLVKTFACCSEICDISDKCFEIIEFYFNGCKDPMECIQPVWEPNGDSTKYTRRVWATEPEPKITIGRFMEATGGDSRFAMWLNCGFRDIHKPRRKFRMIF